MFKRLMAAVTVCATLLLAGCGNDYGVDQHGQKIASERLDKQWKVINYWAEWCGPCKMIAPALDQLATDYAGRAKIVKVDVDQNQQTALKYHVRSIPMLLLFKGGQVQATQHTQVAANAPILGVVDLSRFEIEIKVPESFARDLAIGMPAQISANNGRFAGEIAAVSPEVVNGEVTARVRFADGKQPPGLRQNQRLSVRIVMDTRRDVLMVERGPFLEQDGGNVAWVVDGSSASRRPIRTGASSLSSVEIVSGLKAGERVIVEGLQKVRPGDTVKPHEVDLAAPAASAPSGPAR